MIDFSQALEQINAMLNNFVAMLPNILIAIPIFLLFFILARLVKYGVSRLVHEYSHKENLAIVLSRLARWSTLLLGLLVSVVIIFPDISPVQLFELLGVGSVALGFAFRDVLQNFFAGTLVLLMGPYQIGDQVVIDDFEGTVEHIETRATTLRTYDGRQVVIPNTQMFTSAIVVKTAFERRRVEYDIGIGYEEDIEAVERVLLDVLASIDEVLHDPPPEVLVVALGDFSVGLRVRWWIHPALRSEAVVSRDKVLRRIKHAMAEHAIHMPFPTQHVYISQNE